MGFEWTSHYIKEIKSSLSVEQENQIHFCLGKQDFRILLIGKMWKQI